MAARILQRSGLKVSLLLAYLHNLAVRLVALFGTNKSGKSVSIKHARHTVLHQKRWPIAAWQ